MQMNFTFRSYFCAVESLCAKAGCYQACRVEDGEAICSCQEGWILNADQKNCDRKSNIVYTEGIHQKKICHFRFLS